MCGMSGLHVTRSGDWVLLTHEDESLCIKLQKVCFFQTNNVRRVPKVALNITHP